MAAFTKIVQSKTDHYFDILLRENSLGFDCTVRQILHDFNTTDNTISVGFVLRRYITRNKKSIGVLNHVRIPKEQEVNKLWKTRVTEEVSKKLGTEEFYKPFGVEKRTKEWRKYLTDTIKIHREVVMQLAFLLRMDIKEAEKLLLAAGYEPYNLNKSKEVIIYYCTYHNHEKFTYTWQDVDELLNKYKNYNEEVDDIDYTFEKLLTNDYISEDRDEMLIKLMYLHKDQFDQGYNQEQSNNLNILVNALNILYVDDHSNLNVDILFKDNIQTVMIGQQFKKIKENNEELKRKVGDYINSITPVIKKGINEEEYIERNEVLFLAYSFLLRYSEYAKYHNFSARKDLKDYLNCNKDEFSKRLLKIMEDIDYIFNNIINQDERLEELKNSFRRNINDILYEFGYTKLPLYLPLLLDRFFYLSYLSYQDDHSYNFSKLLFKLVYGNEDEENG